MAAGANCRWPERAAAAQSDSSHIDPFGLQQERPVFAWLMKINRPTGVSRMV